MTNGKHIIEGELTIYTVAEWKEKFLASLLTNEVVNLDLSKVSEIDAAGLQLLIMMKQSATALNKVLRIHSYSPVVLELLDLSGLADFFCD